MHTPGVPWNSSCLVCVSSKDVRNTCQVSSCQSQRQKPHSTVRRRLLVCKPAGIFSNFGEHKESCWFCLHIFFASAEGVSPSGSLQVAFYLILRHSMSLQLTELTFNVNISQITFTCSWFPPLENGSHQNGSTSLLGLAVQIK